MAYLVPERFHESPARGQLGESRIIAGMHLPLDATAPHPGAGLGWATSMAASEGIALVAYAQVAHQTLMAAVGARAVSGVHPQDVSQIALRIMPRTRPSTVAA